LISDEISSTPLGIPVYLPITVQVAIGLKENPDSAFTDWMRAVSKLTSEMDATYVLCEGLAMSHLDITKRGLLSNMQFHAENSSNVQSEKLSWPWNAQASSE
jgi:hypothetical protein